MRQVEEDSWTIVEVAFTIDDGGVECAAETDTKPCMCGNRTTGEQPAVTRLHILESQYTFMHSVNAQLFGRHWFLNHAQMRRIIYTRLQRGAHCLNHVWTVFELRIDYRRVQEAIW
jgi:hypothetical protein